MKFLPQTKTPRDEALAYFKRLLAAVNDVPSLEGKSGASVQLLASLEVYELRRQIQDFYDLVLQGDT